MVILGINMFIFHMVDPKEVMTWHLNSFPYLKNEKRHLMCLLEHHSMRPYFICHKNKLNFLICLIFLQNDKIWYNGVCQYQNGYILQEIEFCGTRMSCHNSKHNIINKKSLNHLTLGINRQLQFCLPNLIMPCGIYLIQIFILLRK